MSRTLIKKEEVPPFMKGMLVMFTICFLFWYFQKGTNKTEARSLPFEVACLPTQDLMNLELAEDILDSEPIVRKKEIPDDEVIGKSDNRTKWDDKDAEGTTYTPTELMDPEVISDPEPEVGTDEEPEAPTIDTQEGDVDSTELTVPSNGTSTVTPTTEREAEIIDTITVTDESQNSNNGSLSIYIERKYGVN